MCTGYAVPRLTAQDTETMDNVHMSRPSPWRKQQASLLSSVCVFIYIKSGVLSDTFLDARVTLVRLGNK